jgi:hypothetical protein
LRQLLGAASLSRTDQRRGFEERGFHVGKFKDVVFLREIGLLTFRLNSAVFREVVTEMDGWGNSVEENDYKRREESR